MSAALIGFVVIAIVVLALIWMAIAVVPEGMHYTVESLGRFSRVLLPGRRLVLPFVERISARVDVTETVLEIPSQTIATSDGTEVTVRAELLCQVIDAAKAAYEVEDYRQAMLDLAATTLRNEIGAMPAANVLPARQETGEHLRERIDQASRSWGMTVSRVELSETIHRSSAGDTTR
jgi:regulator of protease activity HflC (stomatin/prohibitin superfamily)